MGYLPAVSASENLRARVESALDSVSNPRLGSAIRAAGMVHDLVVDDQGQVAFTFHLTREDPATLVRDARKAIQEVPGVAGGKIQPLEAHGVKLMSLGFIVEREAPAIWRGPIIMKIIQQFLRDVAWGELDYFLVDLPPGTGDAQLSLAQSIHLHGAIIVTTPQEMATGDSLRGAKMFERVGVRVLGVVENMSYYVCPHCGEREHLFLTGGGERLAGELGVPLLGQIPLQAGLAERSDAGQPIVVAAPDSPAGTALQEIATRTAELLGAAASRSR